jgi:CBS domain containing-hemolysin-like protein
VEILVLTIALIALLALNAFFVLAEFAIVRVRPSRVAEMAAAGDPRATALASIQHHLDDYLGVCQVGITLASIALGMVGKKGTDVILGAGHDGLRYALTISASYILVSGSHIVLGEQVPKFIGIRVADRAALWSVSLLKLFRWLFAPALWLLTGMSNRILAWLGVRHADQHLSEEELRIILDQSQERGMMSFRRLIFLENVFDFGALIVRDAMRSRATVRSLDANLPWEENLVVVRSSRFTRYPLLDGDRKRPIGFVHLKDLVIRGDPVSDLRSLARPLLTTAETASLESLLVDMQRRRIHAAIVTDGQGEWSGFITRMRSRCAWPTRSRLIGSSSISMPSPRWPRCERRSTACHRRRFRSRSSSFCARSVRASVWPRRTWARASACRTRVFATSPSHS